METVHALFLFNEQSSEDQFETGFKKSGDQRVLFVTWLHIFGWKNRKQTRNAEVLFMAKIVTEVYMSG
jgi:hypothetical protein